LTKLKIATKMLWPEKKLVSEGTGRREGGERREKEGEGGRRKEAGPSGTSQSEPRGGHTWRREGTQVTTYKFTF
jgi:hypothetical protein